MTALACFPLPLRDNMASDSGSVCSLTTDFSVLDPRLELLDNDTNDPPVDTNGIVEDLYEGPQVCGCCINWIDDFPEEIRDKDPNKAKKQRPVENVDEGMPLVVRRWARWAGSGSHLAVDSIEIRHAATRAVLHRVFKDYCNLNPHVRIMVFRAPFKPFFWRWAEFKAAIAAEEDPEVRRILTALHDLVRTDLADVFTIYRELVPNGVITPPYIWTLFSPGDILFQPCHKPNDIGSLYSLQHVSNARNGQICLHLQYIDWDGHRFGVAAATRYVYAFSGNGNIRNLSIYPIRYARNPAALLERFLARGRRFAELTGKRYMSYRRRQNLEPGQNPAKTRVVEERIVLDAREHPRPQRLGLLQPFSYHTNLISQQPVRSTTEGFHDPLPEDEGGEGVARRPKTKNRRPPPPDEWEYERPYGSRPIPGRHVQPPPPPRPFAYDSGETFVHPGHRNNVPNSHIPIVEDIVVVDDDFSSPSTPTSDWDGLTDLQLQLCNWSLQGFSLKTRSWDDYAVDDIHEIEFDSRPFDNLVLPDGYKDLILAFVESQVKDKDSFGDLINGKGGGLTILLSGAPGVGKTLTAESVAEKMQAPLYKLELGEGSHVESGRIRNRSRERSVSPSPARVGADDFTRAFELCAAWGAVLLIDECDLYLEKRSDFSSGHNSLVTRFLRELEYYPSLLFLTTNRERSLDPAVYSRVHLTINYPRLDRASRLQIWKTFLGHMDTQSDMSEAEVEALADIDVDGRRVRNVVKTARIVAKRQQRAICFDDVKNVMRITESLTVEKPEETS